MTQMDAVDTQQQREIDANKVWIKVVAALCTILTLAGIIIFGMLMDARNCPHPDCAHHQMADAR